MEKDVVSVNTGYIICFPGFYQCNQFIGFLSHLIRLIECIADEEVEINFRCVTGLFHGCTCIFYFAQVFTPVEGVGIHGFVKWFAYNIPYFYRFTTGIYYTTDPFIHLFREDVLFLFGSFLDDGIVGFPVEADIIDVSMPLARA